MTSNRDIETVLYDPEIQIKAPYRYDELPDATYIGCYIDYKIISLLVENNGKGHFYCLKPYRKFARECFKRSLELSPSVYFEPPNQVIRNFLLKLGFVNSDNRMVKNG